jgi:hypothetical protein
VIILFVIVVQLSNTDTCSPVTLIGILDSNIWKGRVILFQLVHFVRQQSFGFEIFNEGSWFSERWHFSVNTFKEHNEFVEVKAIRILHLGTSAEQYALNGLFQSGMFV